MIGAVLHQEMLLGGRRFSLHAFRWVYAGWLIMQVLFIFFAYQLEMLNRPGGGRHQSSSPEVVGARFAESFIRQQVILLLLVVPAFVAGAITDEKRKGTLQHLMLTEMESRHLVVGKLLGRACQVVLVMLAGLPLFALMAGFGGVAPVTMLLVGVSLLLPLLGLASATVLASVWCRQTRDAVLALYFVVGIGALLVTLVGGPLRVLDPLHVIEPAWAPAGSIDLRGARDRLLGGAIGWGLICVACLGLASWRLGPAYFHQMEGEGKRKPAWYFEEREPISGDPVTWRERHVEGLAPNATLRSIPQWLGIALVAGLTTLSSLGILWSSMTPRSTIADLCRAILALNVRDVSALLPEAHTGFLIQSVAAMLLFSLLVGIRCSGAITAERERQTWEALLLTPITAKQIVHGKLWGVMAASYAYLLAYAAPALALSVLAGPLGFAYAAIWFVVTVLAMYFIGAAGLWCSVRAPNSWRSLLNTVLVGYLGGLAIYAITSPVIIILGGMMLLALFFVDLFIGTAIYQVCMQNRVYLFRIFWVSSAVGLAAIFVVMSRMFLWRAQRWVADRDRTRHWEDEPFYRRPREAYDSARND